MWVKNYQDILRDNVKTIIRKQEWKVFIYFTWITIEGPRQEIAFVCCAVMGLTVWSEGDSPGVLLFTNIWFCLFIYFMQSLPNLTETITCIREVQSFMEGIQRNQFWTSKVKFPSWQNTRVLNQPLSREKEMYNPEYFNFTHQEDQLANPEIIEF